MQFYSLISSNTPCFGLQFDSHTFKGAGNFSGARAWYESFPEVIRERIRVTGFQDFIHALPTVQGRTDYQPLHALMERWSESTHTFQLPFGEFTVDPVSFAAITGIACAGDPVPLDASLHPLTGDRAEYVETLLGVVPDMKGMHKMKIDSLRAHYTRDRITAIATGREIDQLVRSFLLYLLGTTLFADAASSLDLVFMMPLRDLDLVSSFDWGSCALAFLYRSMDDTVRRARRFCGFWHAALVCFHPFLSLLFSHVYIVLLTTSLFQVWALEIELIVGISSVSDVRFPALSRWGASRAWKRDLLRVHVHRERLNTISFDDVLV